MHDQRAMRRIDSLADGHEKPEARADATQAYRAAAAETELLEAASTAHRLRGIGLHTVTGDPEAPAPRLADLYIRLKAGGRL